MKTTTALLTKNESVVVTDIQNELLIFDPISKEAHVINTTGKIIWNGLKGNLDIEKIIVSLKTLPGASDKDISSEVENFISKMEDAGLLVSGTDSDQNAFNLNIPTGFNYTSPIVETYSEEFLRKHLNDNPMESFHGDTYSDLIPPGN